VVRIAARQDNDNSAFIACVRRASNAGFETHI